MLSVKSSFYVKSLKKYVLTKKDNLIQNNGRQ